MLSPSEAEEALIRSHLREEESGGYVLRRISKVGELELRHLESACHAVLLDLRIPRSEGVEAVRMIGDLEGSVALLCLCRNHKQLRDYESEIHLVDDYVLADRLVDGELATRIGHAIRRRAKETSLLVEQNLLRSLLKNIPDNIYFKDLESRFIKVSGNMARCYGFERPEDLNGKTDFDLFTEEHARPAYEDERAIIRTGKPVVGKVEKETFADGRVNWVTTTKLPLRDERGRIIGTMGISRDITELKETEQKLRDTIGILNDTQLQLIEAEKLKTVGRLAAGVAHEVKNPLSVISMGVDYLREEIDGPPELVEVLGDMAMAVAKANEVIFELLDYASPHELSLVPASLNDVIRRVVTLARHNFNNARVNIREELAEDLEPVPLDAAKMEQVLLNLFLNSIDAMDGGGELTLRTYNRRMSQTGDNVSGPLSELFRIGDEMAVVEIEDTGKGLEPGTEEKLFDPFFSTKETGKGTGLGLAVAQSVVDMHRGLIMIENRPDRSGVRARLFLPTRPSAPQPQKHDEERSADTRPDH